MSTSPPRIAGLGEVLWDLYPDRRFPGGAPANFALHAHYGGARAFLFSRVGPDPAGAELVDYFTRAGVDTSAVQRGGTRPTGSVHVTVDASGQPSFLCSRDTAFDEMVCDSGWTSLAATMDVILFGTLAQREESSRQAIQSLLAVSPDAVKIFDPNLRGWSARTGDIVQTSLRHADILKINENELATLRQALGHHDSDLEFIRALLSRYDLTLVAVTLGSEGCWLVTSEASCRHDGYRVDVVDTTGCGDAFTAALALKVLQQATLEETADFANKVGAYVARFRGAVPPWSPADLEQITLKR